MFYVCYFYVLLLVSVAGFIFPGRNVLLVFYFLSCFLQLYEPPVFFFGFCCVIHTRYADIRYEVFDLLSSVPFGLLILVLSTFLTAV